MTTRSTNRSAIHVSALNASRRGMIICGIAILLIAGMAGTASAQEATPAAPEAPEEMNVNINFGSLGSDASEEDTGGLSEPMKIVLLLSILTLVPSILLTMSSFTRIIIVLSFVRRALSVQQMPPNQIILGLSLFLTAYVMSPVLTDINQNAIQPHLRGEIEFGEAIQRAEAPMRNFMLRQTRQKDLALFARVSKVEGPLTRKTLPFNILVPAFALSEIKTAFQMGFIVYLPMLVLDMVVATLLVSMGMFMLPPAMVSVPLKLLLFVLVDGWHLVIGSLAKSFA